MRRARGAVLRAVLLAAGCGCALSIPLVAPSGAWAQGAAAEPAAKYKLHLGNGVKLFQDGNYPAAIAEFEAAYAAEAKPSALINLALCHKALFKYPRAIAALEKALAEHGADMDQADRQAAQKTVAELSSLLGHVEVKVTPPGATLSVDDEPLPAGAARKPIPLGPGRHKISAEAPGYARADQTVTVASGDKGQTLTFALVADRGWVTVVAGDPRVQIEVDGKRVGAGKWAGFVAPGPHEVAFTPPAGFRQTTSILVRAGQASEVKAGADGVPLGGGYAGMPPPGFYPPMEGPPTGEKPKEPPKPPLEGFYGLVSANLFTNPATADEVTEDPSTGGAFGLRAGWRPATLIGLELMFQYGNITKDVASLDIVGGSATKSLSSTLVGGNVRLMSSGRKVRFVTTLGGGLAYHSLAYEGCDAAADAALKTCLDGSGAEGYFNAEIGLELDFGGVLVGAVVQQVISSAGNISGDSDFGAVKGVAGDVVILLGGGLRIGYGTW